MLKGRIIKQQGHLAIDVSFHCERGSLLALTGPSGAGKTTIIRMLAGLEKPDSGRILFDENAWFDSNSKQFIKTRMRKIGYVFQEHTLFPHLDVAKNVGYSCDDKSRIEELLSTMGIAHLASRKPCQISGGERQRAAIAQALASDPQVLLLDEPFSALDIQTRIRLRNELKLLKSRLDIPVIFVTHDLEEAGFLADTVIELPGLEAQARLWKENKPCVRKFPLQHSYCHVQ